MPCPYMPCPYMPCPCHNRAPGVPCISLIRFVTADLNDRMTVGIDPDTGCPNHSTVGARHAVPLLKHQSAPDRLAQGDAGVARRQQGVHQGDEASLRQRQRQFQADGLIVHHPAA